MGKFTIHASGNQGSGKSTAMGVIESALHHAGYITEASAADPHEIIVTAPGPAEPTPAPETPDELATRLLGDPETLAAVIRVMGVKMTTFDRNALYDEMRRLDVSWCAGGMRFLAATIAAGSFGK